jgi:hypothetical protein
MNYVARSRAIKTALEKRFGRGNVKVKTEHGLYVEGSVIIRVLDPTCSLLDVHDEVWELVAAAKVDISRQEIGLVVVHHAGPHSGWDYV